MLRSLFTCICLATGIPAAQMPQDPSAATRELERLRAENAALKARIRELERAVAERAAAGEVGRLVQPPAATERVRETTEQLRETLLRWKNQTARVPVGEDGVRFAGHVKLVDADALELLFDAGGRAALRRYDGARAQLDNAPNAAVALRAIDEAVDALTAVRSSLWERGRSELSRPRTEDPTPSEGASVVVARATEWQSFGLLLQDESSSRSPLLEGACAEALAAADAARWKLGAAADATAARARLDELAKALMRARLWLARHQTGATRRR